MNHFQTFEHIRSFPNVSLPRKPFDFHSREIEIEGGEGGGGRVMEEAGIGDTGESYIVAYRHIIVHREWQHKSVVRA